MNPLSKNMDFLTKHWAPYARRYPSAYLVVSSDYLPAKTDWVDSRFDTCNFSFILRGQGRYERDGRSWPVQAPCVLAQWPGERVLYGPTEGSWTEWYLTFHRSEFAKFQRHGLVDVTKPVWAIADPASLRLQLAEFARLTRAEDPAWIVDRVDRVAEAAILSTWLAPSATGGDETGIRRVAADLRANLEEDWDFREAARLMGFSTTTFRRRWVEILGVPPARYLQQLRMAEACRLLAETEERVKEIAARVGFEDELYFSRRFRNEIGQSPRAYRRTYALRR